MFRAIASLFLYGTLSPLSAPLHTAPWPVLINVAPPPLHRLALEEELSASGAVVMDMESGRELFARAPDEPRAMGSLVKLLTAIVIVEHHSPQEIVTIPQSVWGIEGNVVGLQPGERYTLKDLLAALLIASANDAAHVLALYHSGSTQEFVREMNARSQALGLHRTRIENPVGFDELGQVSTPRELAWLALYTSKNTLLRSLVSQKGYLMRERSTHREFAIYSTNQLLTTHPATFSGLKTGTTKMAGECIISLAQVAGRQYILVVLNSADRYQDTLRLFHSLSQERT